MKTLVLLSLSLAVALGMPPFVLTGENQKALVGDLVPEQGHVVVDDPLPQVSQGSKEQQEKLAPVPVDMEQSQSVGQPEVKVKPEVGVEQGDGVKTEVKPESEVKKEPEVQPEPEVKVEQEVKPEPEVKVEQEVKPEQEIKAEPEVKVEQEVEVEQELKAEPEVKVEQEFKVELEIKAEPDVKVEQEVKEEQEVEVEQELKAEPEVKVEPEVEVEQELKAESEVKVDLEANVEPEVNLNPEVMAELDDNVKPEVESELKDDPDFKVESEVKVELDVQEDTKPEVEPMFNEEQEVQEEFHVQMNLEEETETGGEFEERHIDMERNSEMVGKPIMELELLDDDNMFGEEPSNAELSEVEKSLRAAFQNQDRPVPEEKPIMELEPETEEEPFLHQRVVPNAAIMEEGPALDIMGQPIPSMEEYFPNEEARMGMEPGKQQHSLTEDGSDYLVMEEVKVDLEANVEPEVNLNPEVMAELDDNVKPEVEMESELKDDPDFKVESEVKVELDVQEDTKPEVEPMFNEEQEVQEEFHVQMNLEEETETGGEFEERHIDMERNSEMVGKPIMELEPLDDDNMFGEEPSNAELSEVEKSLRAAFQNQDRPVPEEEPIMELEPEMEEEPFLHQRVVPNAAIMEEGPALDIMGQPIPSMEEYFPNEEARMGMEPGKQQHSLTEDGSDYLVMEEPRSDFVNEEEPYPVREDSPGGVQTGLVPKREERALMRQGVISPVEGRSSEQDKQGDLFMLSLDKRNDYSVHEPSVFIGQSCSTGVVHEGKCYHFFKGPKAAADAEFFCQEYFPGGHLASITSPHIHRDVINMIRQQNRPYRAWVGGLRYLQTGRFIWLDGSHWGYADWLSGEPNNVSDVEDCVELLAHREGRFNDSTCWEPQAFICSFPH